MNEKGISLLETVLAVVILSVIALSLLPLLQQLQAHLYTKQLAYYASEVAFNGAKMMQSFAIEQGVMEIEGVLFHWQYTEPSLCVAYEGLKGQEEACISY